MSRSSPNRLDLAIVVAVAFIANFIYLFFSSSDFYFPDSFTYLAPAKSLLAGSGFLSPLGNPDTIRTPGYPLLLAAFGARTPLETRYGSGMPAFPSCSFPVEGSKCA